MPEADDRLLELRILDGPNLYFPRPAVKLTLEVSPILSWDRDVAERAATRLGLGQADPGGIRSPARRRFAARLLARLTRLVAREAGVRRLAIRSRPASEPDALVIAYPWRRREAARGLGERVAELANLLLDEGLPSLVRSAGAALSEAEPGEEPSLPTPDIPVVGVTGTNGKTTVTRLLAHVGRTAGLKTGWCITSGIFYQGELLEEGDWSGYGGAGRVLSQPGIELAVLEVARGGMLLRGIGAGMLDVAVVTNVSEDHLGEYGVETLDQLAEVKGMIVRIVSPSGWTVLNADDPRVLAMRTASPGLPFVFSRDAENPGIRAALNEGGRAATVMDERIAVLDRRGRSTSLIPVREVPITLAGLSSVHVENALAVAAAALGVAIPEEQVVEGLATFHPDPEQNPGRLNLWQLSGRMVVVDYAHNEKSLQGLLEVMRGLNVEGGSTWVIIGTAGDRSDRLIRVLGEVAAGGADHVAICEKERYLRDRDRAEMTHLMQQGAARFGKEAVAYPTELESLVAVVERSGPTDVVGLCCHVELAEITEWLHSQGARLIGQEELLRRVRDSGP